jgi:hypothetical protein
MNLTLKLPLYMAHSEWNQAHPQDAEYDQRLADRAISEGRKPVRTSICSGMLREWDRDNGQVHLRCDLCGKELLDAVTTPTSINPDRFVEPDRDEE